MKRAIRCTAAFLFAAGCGGGMTTGAADMATAAPDLSTGTGGDGSTAGPDLAAGMPVRLHNMADKEDELLVPDDGEEKHWAAVRLTPPSYPFQVTSVTYFLTHGMQTMGATNCKADLAHAVEVYVDAATTPPRSPTVAARIDVPAAMGIANGERKLTHLLPNPVMLAAGQHLFVAVQYAGKRPAVPCLQATRQNPIADRNYWSNAEKAPYDWATLDSFMFKANLRIEALGTPK